MACWALSEGASFTLRGQLLHAANSRLPGALHAKPPGCPACCSDPVLLFLLQLEARHCQGRVGSHPYAQLRPPGA